MIRKYIRDRQCVGILRFSICFFSAVQPDMPCDVEKVLKSVRGFLPTLPPPTYARTKQDASILYLSVCSVLSQACACIDACACLCTRPLITVFCAGHTLREVVVCRW